MNEYSSSDYARDKLSLANLPAYRSVNQYRIKELTRSISLAVDVQEIHWLQGQLKHELDIEKDIKKAVKQ